MQNAIAWKQAPDGTLYTQPRRFTIEALPNGLYRLFHYGPNMSDLFETQQAAIKATRRVLA